MLNLLARGLSVTPDTPTQFKNLVSQYAGTTALAYGANKAGWIDDSLVMATLFSQMGQGSRAGTQYARLIQQLFKSGKGASPAAVKRIEDRMTAAEQKIDKFAIRSELVDLKKRVEELEQRLADLESQL